MIRVLAGVAVSVWVTTADESSLLKPQPPLHFEQEKRDGGLAVAVDDRISYQTIDGFGASLTDSSAWLLWHKLSAAERTALLKSLFDPSEGIGLSFLRQPMGASDFSSAGHYSYDDPPSGKSDPELRYFTIAHDLKYIVPQLKEIKSINPKLKLMANPWSPPGWMKTSGSMIGGTLLPEAYGAWAAYFVKFIQAYEAEGIAIDYVSMQNEPLNVPPDYPGMKMEADTQVRLLVNHLGPAFARAGVKAKILGWDHNWANSYPYEILKNSQALELAAGTSWHCYGGNVDSQGELQKLFPTRDQWQTECSGFTGSTFAKELRYDLETLIIGVMRQWGRASLRWNLALDEKNGPRSGGCPNCTALVTIDSRTGDVTRNVDYYGLGHASKFVAPGAVRIDSSTHPESIANVAFMNPDGSRVVVALNADARARRFRILWRGQAVSYELPAGAAATFKWNGGAVPPAERRSLTAADARPATLAIQSVAASSTERVGTEPALAVDGNGLTRWSSTFSDPQWIAVDLGKVSDIGRVLLNWESACGKAYQIQVSNDNTEWTTVVEATDCRGGVVEHKLAARGRYVRVYGTARATEYGYSLWELQLYGAAAAPLEARLGTEEGSDERRPARAHEIDSENPK